MQAVMWLGRCGASREVLDDLAEAFYGVLTRPSQLSLSVVAFRERTLKAIETSFAISIGHLFGLAAAVVNFNRLPELLTAVCRRIGSVATWHFYDDQGVLTIRYAGVSPVRDTQP